MVEPSLARSVFGPRPPAKPADGALQFGNLAAALGGAGGTPATGGAPLQQTAMGAPPMPTPAGTPDQGFGGPVGPGTAPVGAGGMPDLGVEDPTQGAPATYQRPFNATLFGQAVPVAPWRQQAEDAKLQAQRAKMKPKRTGPFPDAAGGRGMDPGGYSPGGYDPTGGLDPAPGNASTDISI